MSYVLCLTFEQSVVEQHLKFSFNSFWILRTVCFLPNLIWSLWPDIEFWACHLIPLNFYSFPVWLFGSPWLGTSLRTSLMLWGWGKIFPSFRWCQQNLPTPTPQKYLKTWLKTITIKNEKKKNKYKPPLHIKQIYLFFTLFGLDL